MDNKKTGNVFLKSLVLCVVFIGLAFITLIAFHGFHFDAEKSTVATTKTHKPKVIIPVYEFNGISASARLSGKLTLKNGCLYGAESLLVFPENLVKWDDKNQILTYKDQTYRIGQEFVFAGGNSKLGDNVPRITNLSVQCREEYVWLVG
jgi:hypothetical protein